MTTKYDNFVKELEQLCIKHQVCIDPGYEGYTVRDMQKPTGFLDLACGAFWQDITPIDGTEE